jgi:hypothetical protein
MGHARFSVRINQIKSNQMIHRGSSSTTRGPQKSGASWSRSKLLQWQP